MRWLYTSALLAMGAAFAQEEVAVPAVVRIEGNLWAELLILFGCFFILVSAIGVVRFPDVYTRLHASTKLVTLGGLGIFGGGALAFLPVGATERVLLIFAFFFLTAPLSGYMVARTSYFMGLPMYKEDTTVDEYGEFGSLAEPSVEEVKEGAEPAGNDGVS